MEGGDKLLSDVDARYLNEELSVIKHNIDDIQQIKNLATIKDILNNIHFADITSPLQVVENLGNGYIKKFNDEEEIYDNIPLSYIVTPKKTGVFYGSLYIKKDKEGIETKCSKAAYFQNYARFIIDVVSQKVIYSKQLDAFVIVEEFSYKPISHDNFNDYYNIPRNNQLYMDDFLDVMLEVFKNHIKERHEYKLFPAMLSGKDWRFNCEELELENLPPKEKELFFAYYDYDLSDIDTKKAEDLIVTIANDEESANNLRLVHAYILMRKLKLIPAEKWFLLKDFGRTGKGLIVLSLHSIFRVNPVNMDALVNNQGASTENAWLSFKGADVAHANETGAIDRKGMRVLRKIATGEIITGRSLGNNAITYKNESVLILDTNETVDIGQITANVSRTVKIAFKDRPKNETTQERHEIFKPYWDFIQPQGELSQAASVAFLLNSLAYLKQLNGQFVFKDALIKNYASADDLTETQRILVLTIAKHGFILAGDETLQKAIQEDYGNLRFKAAKEAISRIGVAMNVQKWIDGTNCKVHQIKDKKLFDATLQMIIENDTS